MNPIFMYILYSAKRDKFAIGILLAIVLSSFVASFLGSTSLVEPDQMRIIYAAHTARLVLIVGMMVFIAFQIKKMFDSREMDVFFSRIPSKMSIVTSFVGAFLIIASVIILAMFVLFSLLYPTGFVNLMYWTLTLFLECLVVIPFAVFFSTVIRSSSLGLLISFAMYFITRAVGSFVAYIDISRTNASLISASEFVIKFFSVIIPRLDLYSKSSFIVYGDYSMQSFAIIFFQAVFYAVLIIMGTVFDLRNKEF